MTPDQDKTTTAHTRDGTREQCAECGATLVEDQRYCLQCGARRGEPRVDFTAFWGQLSPTDAPPMQGEAQGAQATDSWYWLGTGAPSRRVAGALVTMVLAAGIVTGAALGPAPASSPADDSTAAQHALAALVARARDSSQPSAPSPGTPPAESDPTTSHTTTTHAKAAARKAKPKQPTASDKASLPSPSESSSSSESSSGSSSTESSSKGSGEGESAAPGTPVKLPPIKHVWLITLSGESLSAALADPTANPYLARQLAPKGALLSGFTLSAGSALGNGVALLSGQSVNLDTEQNCPSYAELQPPTIDATNGLAEGVGCVYPAAVKTLADELTAAGLTWKAYVQDMGGQPASAGSPPAQASTTTVTCRRPVVGAHDPNQIPGPGDPYLTFRNPFVYFHSLLDGGACASDDVDESALAGDLAAPSSTPNLSWIVPTACDDGSGTPCAPGAASGPGGADGFLKVVVPQILATAAYREGGLIAIVPDSAPASSVGSPTKPVGALLISPFVRRGEHASGSFNDFSLLKSLTRLFGVLPLGHANDPSAVSFGATVYRTTK